MDVLGLTLVSFTSLLLIGLGALESLMHRRNLRGLRIRVHVNGTRGKSSVTRLIAAGLRASGIRTCAKTTGTLPRLIHPDGIEEPIYRVGRPNVIEQVAVVRRARRLKAEALIVECMALQPFLQWVSTASLVRPTHGVITNIRADHLEVMGPTTGSVARALAGSVPVKATLFTSETHHLEALWQAARDRGTEIREVTNESAECPVTPAELQGFQYIEHADNVALALAVCAELGVDREAALRGMQASRPDPGALTIEQCRISGTRLSFINGFAANDPESTGQVWELVRQRSEAGARHIALINCRLDRPERSAQLGEAVNGWSPADYYLVCGTGTNFFVHAAERSGLDLARVQVAEEEEAHILVGRLAQLAGNGGVVVGLGNIGGVGLSLIETFRERTEMSA